MYQKLRSSNTSFWKQFCLFLVILFCQFFNLFSQKYVDGSVPQTCVTSYDPCPPASGSSSDMLIDNVSGIGIGWGANLYLQSEIGSSNTIFDLSWVLKLSNPLIGSNTFTYGDVDIWMYEFDGNEFPNTLRPAVENWIPPTGTPPIGVSNVVKVVSNKSLVIKTPGSSPSQKLFTIVLDNPYNYSGNKSLVIYIQNKTPEKNLKDLTSDAPIFKHNSACGRRRICNWSGTVLDPLNNNANNSFERKFARVMINKSKSGQDVIDCSTGNIIPSECTNPVISNKTRTICSNSPFSYLPPNTAPDVVPSDTKFKWSFIDNPNVTGEVEETTGTTSIDFSSNLINTSTTTQVVEYSVTPSSGDCIGTPFTLNVTVNPAPKISDISKTICSGETFDITPVHDGTNTIIPTGTTYTWPTPVISNANSITGHASATSVTSISQTLKNTTNSDQTATYTITANTTSTPACNKTFTAVITVKAKIDTSLTITAQPDCVNPGTAQITNFLPPAIYTFKPSTGISVDGSGKISAASGSYKFFVTIAGCSDSSRLFVMKPAPGKPVLEGPSSVCVGSEITLKAWEDNPVKTKSTPNVATPWKVKDSPSDLDTVSLTVGTDPAFTSNTVKGKKAVSVVKSGVVTIVYTDNNGCTAEQTIDVNPLPELPVLSHVPASPLVFTGNKADTVCKGSNVNYELTGTVGDSVFFKGKNGPFRYKILPTLPNVFTINNLLKDTTIILDSISNGKCSSNFSGLSSITLPIKEADTAFSLKSTPISQCLGEDGIIEVKVSSIGKLIWKSTNLTTPISDSILVKMPLVNDSIYKISNALTKPAKLKKGNYTVSFNNGGCLLSKSISISEPNSPYLEGPSSVCVGSEIELKAWTDKPVTKSVSIPNGITPWKVKVSGVVDTVSFASGSTSNSSKVKGLQSATSTKPAELIVEYTDINGCKTEHNLKVNPLPVVPVLSHVPSNPLVFTGNKADTVCKGSDVEFTLTGGTIGDKVYFKDTLSTASTPLPIAYLIKAQNNFNRKNVLADINVVIDSVSNGLCRINALPLKIVMADTAFSLKATPTSKCLGEDGMIEVKVSSIGKLIWKSTNLTTPISDSIVVTLPLVNDSIYKISNALTKPAKLKKGNYTVSFNNGGCLLSESVKISDPKGPYIEPSTTADPLALCAGDSIVLKAWTDNTATKTKSIPKSPISWTTDNTNVILKDTLNIDFTIIKVIAVSGGSSIITYTDINDCSADTLITINTANAPNPSIFTQADKNQQFCVSDNAKVSDLKPTNASLVWFDEKGKTKLATDLLLKTQKYYAALQDPTNGCYTKKDERVEVDVKIITNPAKPVADDTLRFCKVSNPTVAELIPAPSQNIKWYLKTGSTLTEQTPLDFLGKKDYIVKYYKDGCLSVEDLKVYVDTVGVEKPKAPTFKLCANNQATFKLEDIYKKSNYFFFDGLKNPLFSDKIITDGEICYVSKEGRHGCLSDTLKFKVKFSEGVQLPATPLVLTPAFCLVDKPTLNKIEDKFLSLLPTLTFKDTISWYPAEASSNFDSLGKNEVLAGNNYNLWANIKDVDGCFSKKYNVKFTIDPGKTPTLRPIELCKTSEYQITDLDVSNISSPAGILTWYLSQTGSAKAPPTVPKNSTEEYWASYKETATSCEGERKKLSVSFIDLSQNLSLTETQQKFCKTANKTVDDLNPAPYSDANVAWFESTTSTTPYENTDPIEEKTYYAAEYKITSKGDYCVSSSRVSVSVSLYSNKMYPLVKESVCSKQNGSIEFLNPPAGVTFDWYEQKDPNTLDFTGAKYTKPLENQSFKIKIKDASGCEEEVSVALPECTVSPIPQILSPNGDKYNNKWAINYSGKYKNVQVRIFNRWGNEIYTSSIPYKDDWEGKYNNEYLPSGTYYYVIDKGNGEPVETGFIEFVK